MSIPFSVDNFKPGTLERLKLDYEQLKQVNPRIIHASIAGELNHLFFPYACYLTHTG